jgi:pSer/pThr/pTyr-binding forkhead associated (FHA) protein
MARLVVQPGSPAAWEIKLQAGANSLGRNPANDFKLDDPSVSGSHCQIVVESGNAIIRDLGSTNGTYVNRSPVKEATLQHGQTIHLGSLELVFYSDVPAYGGAAPPAAAPRPVASAPPLPPPRAAAPAGVARVSTVPTIALGPDHPPPPVAAPPVAVAPTSAVGSGPCKHHPKTPGRYFCSQCQLFFCEICVTARGLQKVCRHCGAPCVPVQVQIQRPTAVKGFFYRFPGAFIYPFRGTGLLVLIVSTIMLTALTYLGFIMFAIPGRILLFGYLFCYMQNIIHATANEENQMPDLPGFDDIFGGAFRFAVTMLICFALPIAFVVLRFFGVFAHADGEQIEVSGIVLIVTTVLGGLYFPMAFLAVAMKDTAWAANPLQVIPSIFKVPLEYLVAAIAFAGVLGLRALGPVVIQELFPRGMATHSIPKLLEMFAARTFWSLASLYLLTVGVRILGLLYVTRKDKLGWYNR